MEAMARKREKADEERRPTEPGAPLVLREDEEPKRRRVDAPGAPSFGADLADLLVEKLTREINLDLLLEKVSPELSKRVFAAISIDDLGEKVIELLATKLLEKSELLETLSKRLLEKF